MTLEERLSLTQRSLGDYFTDPGQIEQLEIEEQLDILASMQFYYELQQAYVRSNHSEHSAEFMAAHADVNYWKNKVMNAKVQARIKIANKERGA